MSGKRENKKRRVFNTYNLLVLLSLVIIIGAGYVLLERQGVDVASYLPVNEVKDFFASIGKDEGKESKNVEDIPVMVGSSDNNNVNEQARGTNTNNTPEPTAQTSSKSEAPETNTKTELGEISEEEARTIAKSKFKELGETNINAEELEVLKIKRKEQLYYHVSSKDNHIEIKISDGTIARVNGVATE
ncbi:MAG: hypothetical protein HFJ51_01115 [Clostridia bacterium]|nr:hypothetical protein [Clostridia bacterium]